jgi:curli biogenesis system outer membrane secretion channel CsgG
MKLLRFAVLICLVAILVACGPDYKPVEVRKDNSASLDQQLNNLTAQIIASFNQSNVSKIAVIEFADLEGNVTQLGRFIAEELITRIFTTGRFDVVERNLLQKVLEEQKLGMTGYIDQETAISLGQILGVDAIITGSISDLGPNIKINARLISTESGSVFAVASVTVTKDNTIKLLMGETIREEAEGTESTYSQPRQGLQQRRHQFGKKK